MNEDAIVLSYEDSLLYQADVKLLEPGGWINDKIVGFAFEYFANKQFKDISDDICFISPEVSQFLKLCQGRSAEEISDFLKPLDLPDMKYVIVPVNDHSSLDGAGGTHWSTMIYSKNDEKIFYLDSFGGYNSKHARLVQQKIGVCFQAFRDAPLVSVKCPQQRNLNDCGLYAICYAEEVCKGLQCNREDFYNVDFSPDHVSHTRKRLKDTIFQLAKK